MSPQSIERIITGDIATMELCAWCCNRLICGTMCTFDGSRYYHPKCFQDKQYTIVQKKEPPVITETLMSDERNAILASIQKQLTNREYEGYLKGKILEIRLSLNSRLSPTEAIRLLANSEAHEARLMTIQEQRELEAAAREKAP